MSSKGLNIFSDKELLSIIKNLEKYKHYSKSVKEINNILASNELSYWKDYITNAVSSLNDDKIYTLFVPSKGTDGHPSIDEQQELANTLISFINNNNDW